MLRRMIWCAAFFVAPHSFAQVPVSTVGPATGVLNEGFSMVSGVQELRDGRIVVSDARERRLLVGDFRSGAVTQLGRNGQGPKEYEMVAGLFRTAGDTIQMSDFPSRRILRIAADGDIIGATVSDVPMGPLPDEKDVTGRIMSGTRYIDRAGVHYSLIQYIEPGVGVRPNDAFIAATDHDKKTFRRVAPVQPWYPARSTRWRAPLMYGDAWAVAPDGRVARVIPTDYHVEWYRNGQLIAKGPPTSFTPVKTTQADRDAWYAARAAQPQAGAGMRGAGATPPASSSPPSTSSRPALRPMTDADFPEFMPPFLEEYSGKGAIVAPNGELWVTRVVPRQEKFALADVFDAKGHLVRQVKLPQRTRVVGFGQSALFLQREDDDGVQWVQRHPIP